MFPVSEEWLPRLRAHLLAARGEDRAPLRLLATDFPPGQSVTIRFDDGSLVSFRHAFAVRDETGRRVMVFTEHCGYHVFPVGMDVVEVTRGDGEPPGD